MKTLSSFLNFPKKIFNEPGPDLDTNGPSNSLLAPSTYKVAVAIDFGTDGVALAYQYNNEVHPHTQWEYSRMDQHAIKLKTKILLNGSGKKIAFGRDAHVNYVTTDSKTSKEWMLFENLKMHLYDPQNTYTFSNIDIENIDYMRDDNKKKNNEYKINELANELVAVNGSKYSSELVFIEIFKHLKKESKSYLKKHKIKASDSEIEYILTVPSIWNEKAKYKLKKWAEKAGLFRRMEQCRIVYEPDAASIFIQHELYYHFIAATQKIAESKSHESIDSVPNLAHIGNLSRLLKQQKLIIEDQVDNIDAMPKFEKEMQYILIDGGGFSVDVACHEVVGEFGHELGVKEVLPPTGGAWGSNFIDQQYKILLINLFSSEWINEYIKLSPHGWSCVMDKFRFAKSNFFLHQHHQHHEVQLPLEFLAFLEAKLEEKEDGKQDLQTFVNKIKVNFKSNKKKRSMLRLSDNGLLMSVDLWKCMFNSVINPIIKHCEQLLESDFLYNVQYLCLVGGLCSSKYFQKRMEKSFGWESMHRLQIIVPSKPVLSIVLGAAYLSITKNYIRSRILNATYGIEIDKTLQSAEDSNVSDYHIEQFKYYNDDLKDYFVRNCFCIYARKKETIQTGQIIEKIYNRIPLSAKKIKVKIFYSVISHPTVTTSAVHLGDLILRFDDENVKQVVVEFHFYDTTIKIYSYPKNQKHKKREIKLDYALTDLD